MSLNDEITLTDQERPSEPPAYDIESDPNAPEWAKFLSNQITRSKSEDKAQLNRIERNLETNYRSTQRLSKRVNEHDSELEEVRVRVDHLEVRLDDFERDQT